MQTLTFLLNGSYLSANLYLDPGSGSFLLQLILASIFGALFAVKAVRQKIGSIFSNLFGSEKESDHRTDDTHDSAN